MAVRIGLASSSLILSKKVDCLMGLTVLFLLNAMPTRPERPGPANSPVKLTTDSIAWEGAVTPPIVNTSRKTSPFASRAPFPYRILNVNPSSSSVVLLLPGS